jgi:hypothetical protein
MWETQEYLPSVWTVAWCCWKHDDDGVEGVAEGEVQANPGNAEKSSRKTKVARSIHPIFSLSFLQPPSSPRPPLSSSAMTMTMRKKKMYWS